jgi:hypothetical protein
VPSPSHWSAGSIFGIAGCPSLGTATGSGLLLRNAGQPDTDLLQHSTERPIRHQPDDAARLQVSDSQSLRDSP